MIGHIDEEAALYALGALDEVSRRRVDAHVATCPACAKALAEAESDVASMVAADTVYLVPSMLARPIAPETPVNRTRPWYLAAAAVAAIFAIGIMPTAYFWRQSQAMHAQMTLEADAMNRLSTTTYRTAAFTTTNGEAPARVMYGPDGSWYVVLVRGASRALQVAWMHDGQRTMLGTAEPNGDVAMLYLPKSHRMDRLALMDGETVVAEAQLAY